MSTGNAAPGGNNKKTRGISRQPWSIDNIFRIVDKLHTYGIHRGTSTVHYNIRYVPDWFSMGPHPSLGIVDNFFLKELGVAFTLA